MNLILRYWKKKMGYSLWQFKCYKPAVWENKFCLSVKEKILLCSGEDSNMQMPQNVHNLATVLQFWDDLNTICKQT